MSTVSTKPYLLRALYEWCVDQALTPYIAVMVDERTGVPRQYVRDGQIILNIGPEAVHQLVMGNDVLSCSARFGGVAQQLTIPVDCVAAIYARENGHGMAFEVGVSPTADSVQPKSESPSRKASKDTPSNKKAGNRGSHLRRVK